MSSNDHKSTPPPASKDTLLDELESIKGLLDDSFDTDIDDDDLSIDIPILDDVVTPPENNDTNETSLLNLEQIFDEEDDSESLDSELTKMEELDLDGLDLEDLNAHVDIPSFKLQAEISDHIVAVDDVPAPPIEPLSAQPAATASDINPKDQGLFFEDEMNIIEDDIWLSDDPAADAPSDLSANDPFADDLFADNLFTDKETNNEAAAAQTATSFSEEEQEDMFPDLEQRSDTSSDPQEHKASVEGDLDLNFLIQEIVDEVIPRIEDELRQRLSQYSHTAIKQLADKYLDN